MTNESIDGVTLPKVTVGAHQRDTMDGSDTRLSSALRKSETMGPVQLREFINPITFQKSVPFYSGHNLSFSPILPSKPAQDSKENLRKTQALPSMKKSASV